MNDAKDYVTRKDHEMYWIDDPEHPPPMNKTVWLVNEGGTGCKGKLTPDNITHFTHWIEMPVVPKTKHWLEKKEMNRIDYANIGTDAEQPSSLTKRGTRYIVIGTATNLPEEDHENKTWEHFDEMFTNWLASRSRFGVIWRKRPVAEYTDDGKRFTIHCRVAWEEEEAVEKGVLNWEKMVSAKIKATVAAHSEATFKRLGELGREAVQQMKANIITDEQEAAYNEWRKTAAYPHDPLATFVAGVEYQKSKELEK